MPISVSTDPIRPTERQAYLDRGDLPVIRQYRDQAARLHRRQRPFRVRRDRRRQARRFDSSPQCYTRDARLVSRAGSDEFMFDFQRRGDSAMVQAGNEGTINPGYGVLYDARRPFEDRLFGPEQRAEVLIATVPAAAAVAGRARRGAAMRKTRPLSGTVARAIAAFVREAIAFRMRTHDNTRPDIVAYLSAPAAPAAGSSHQLSRPTCSA
jgi:hypothetical protein